MATQTRSEIFNFTDASLWTLSGLSVSDDTLFLSDPTETVPWGRRWAYTLEGENDIDENGDFLLRQSRISLFP